MDRIFRNILFYALIFLVLIGVISLFKGQNDQSTEFNVQQFMQALDNGEIAEMTMQPKNKIMRITGELEKDKKPFIVQVPDNTEIIATITEKATEQSVLKVAEEEQPSAFVNFLTMMLPFLIIGLIFFFIFTRAQGGGGGGRVMNFGKSKAKLYNEEKAKVRFTDVAGADEEKQELVEVVEFLKDPRKFTKVGARIPKGVLLVGPPGTGKTLLARAVAGEAGTPFFSISGSDFVEMFVGVGASRVRDLFENAKKNAPCIIFIDEIDAVGRQRGAGLGGGHDEREQTLNQLLVEMDGFDGNEGIIMIAATNRPDILDPALLRPGRFDRQIPVNRPDVKGREAVLHVHARNKPLAEDVDLKIIAMRTPGFSGADLENLLNEAALVTARGNKKKITMEEIDEAIDRVIAGPAKKSRVVSDKERKIVAYHEGGHTVIGMVLDDADTVHKVTIVPRGQAGGYAMMLPKEDRYLATRPELFDRITGLLGGRVAEEIIFGKDHVSTGASNDFQRATAIANKMITEYGMSDKIGPTQFTGSGGDPFLGRDIQSEKNYSEALAHEIDVETQNFINYCYDRAKTILTENRDKLELIAEMLLEHETLDAEQIKSLFEDGVMPEVSYKKSSSDQEDQDENDHSTSTNEDNEVKVNISAKQDDETTPDSYEEAKDKVTKDDQETDEQNDKKD
ncbi:ATP-dependent zinc metalloprotease FtsH [Pseudogracilibacillus auburnensis]|uniref:ATP-dependent zinc metalloprotease FtsH n=1 Tax=Pseudogracilibacillus auburnensis TaxID=1494959 RepID=A0A2V3VI97_9BACI|nr:ATP-dependent zinc metalloprotease FtsH [Pseudogracilibacillus auburnensis]MBO1004439.1 ATP-dependent zinc metalloprotease FtsH [Pseudogracilibacillus auburnensis]PXW81566.1 membrane protease FtsH catalytic subunit [Pseudogracilibacillus auburnensis]